LRYFKTLVPWLVQTRAAGNDWTFFYEVKANLRKEQLAMMRDAGIVWIQPGIESLSSRVLKLMDKGITGLQNIRLLKWAREYGIKVSWNLLYGFPGEEPADYEEIFDTLLSISHLEAPGVARLLLERFSPYFENPEKYGIRILGPVKHYELIYPVKREMLMKLAYDFQYWIDDLTPNPFIARIHERVKRLFMSGGAPSTLIMTRGIDFIRLSDRRRDLPNEDYILSGTSAAIYLACDGGASHASLLEKFGAEATAAAIDGLLQNLTRKRLLYREGETYLALATAMRPVLPAASSQSLALNDALAATA
jgi:ribosomal peptide maturation radical SAM protein 1